MEHLKAQLLFCKNIASEITHHPSYLGIKNVFK